MSKKKITRKLAIELFCWDCMGHYIDGKVDCENVNCSMYEFMPYRKLEPSGKHYCYNPRKNGHVTWEQSAALISEERRDKMVKIAKERFGHK